MIIVGIQQNLNTGENPERYLPGRCTINITIYDSYDVTESQVQRRIKNLVNCRKRSISEMHGWYQSFCQKWKRIGNPASKNIESGHRGGLQYIKMCHAYNEKWENTHGGRNRTTKPRKIQHAQRNRNLKNSWEYWKGIPANNRKRREKILKESQENKKTIRNPTI